MQSLFDRLGGMEAIMAAADLFYEKVLADPLTKPFFEDIDMQVQTKKMVSFMAVAFDGPKDYRGRDMREAHRALVKERGLTDAHFDAVAVHLEATLSELGIEPSVRQEVLSIVGSTRAEVLNR